MCHLGHGILIKKYLYGASNAAEAEQNAQLVNGPQQVITFPFSGVPHCSLKNGQPQHRWPRRLTEGKGHYRFCILSHLLIAILVRADEC